MFDNFKSKILFWRDRRTLGVLSQLLILLIVVAIFLFLGNNLVNNLQQKNIGFSFGFLNNAATFDIGDKVIDFGRGDSYLKAILVGLLNSFRVMVLGIILATLLGVAVGIGKLADNWLVRQIATVYVDILRNTPLLLQLFFWYSAVFLNLPKIENPLTLLKSVYLTNRGVYIPSPAGTVSTWLAWGFIVGSTVLMAIIWNKRIQTREWGFTARRQKILLVTMAIAIIFAFVWGLNWQQPQLDAEANTIVGGLHLLPELASLLIGLSVYTGAYIAEIVRAGIESVDKGQWEAARALGLKSSPIMQSIVFPQALRVIIPPLTNEYLNLAKNSSLALAVGYNDLYSIANTISNNTGRSLEILLIVIAIYLAINLIISSFSNWYNARIQF